MLPPARLDQAAIIIRLDENLSPSTLCPQLAPLCFSANSAS